MQFASTGKAKTKEESKRKSRAKARRLQDFFGGIELAVFAGVEERHVGVRALVAQIDFATVERLRVNVNADGALVEFREIDYFVNGLDGIHIRRMRGVEIVGIRRNDFASAVRNVALIDAIVLHAEAADGRGHPAALVAMIVDAAVLADFPADGHALEEIVLENQIARVAALRKITIGVERFGADGVANNVVLDVFQCEVAHG